jgi:cell division protein FtsA
VLPLGGNQITNDIVYVLHTPQNTAEYLKLKYGSAIAREPGEGEDDTIDTESFSPGERQQISRFYLNEIIQARVEQILELVGNEIRRSGYEGLLPAGVVLTGGSSQLAGLDELARDMLGLPVRVGVPTQLVGLADAVDAPPYATGVGLVRWGVTKGLLHHAPGARPAEPNNWRNVYDRFKLWLKEFLP